jgi:Ser/Thr protein kinase RdoA (MazF antagonist)
MSPSALDPAARHVLGDYALPSAPAHPLGNHGGFSGARLWRVEAGAASFCLRAWPPDDPTPQRLRWLHHLMAAARGAGLAFVPHVVPAGSATFLEHVGRLWELTAWLPGRADFHQYPSPARLRAACLALARLHHAWAALFPAEGACPALGRRQKRAAEWLSLARSGWRPRFAGDDGDPVRPWAERAWRLLTAWAERVPALLDPWAGRRFALHPCLCDVWHDHVLFEGDAVSGVVDYGSAKVDHASADLARLLGSLVGDDAAGWAAGEDAYAEARPLAPGERALARALDRTGVILAAANWLTWLYRDGRTCEDSRLVADRLAGLVRRMEAWPL